MGLGLAAAVFVALIVPAIWFGFRRGQGDRLALGLLVALAADAFVLAGWFGHSMNTLYPLAAIACGRGSLGRRPGR